MDFLKLMQQASQMQARMQALQAEMAQRRVTGQAGGGKVVVTLDGHGQAQGVVVDPSLLQLGDPAVVGDLILGAFREAQAKAQAQMAEEVAKVTGGLQLPFGLNQPVM